MSDEQIIALLTEMRNLQRQNVENYKLALQKQEEAIELQKKSVADFQQKYVARQRMVILTVVAITIISFIIVAVVPALLPRVNH
jgi:hypothetical protein